MSYNEWEKRFLYKTVVPIALGVLVAVMVTKCEKKSEEHRDYQKTYRVSSTSVPTVGRGQFDKAQSTANRKTPNDADWKNICFAVFDAPQVAGDFLDRLAKLKKALAHVPNWVMLVQQTTNASHAKLNEKLRQVVDAGGEGLMLRQISAPYIPCRYESIF